MQTRPEGEKGAEIMWMACKLTFQCKSHTSISPETELGAKKSSPGREIGQHLPPFPGSWGFLCWHLFLPRGRILLRALRSRQHHPLSSTPAPKCKLTLHSCFVLKGHAPSHTFRLLSRRSSGLRPFFFPALLRYRWHETPCEFKVCNTITWCTCI